MNQFIILFINKSCAVKIYGANHENGVTGIFLNTQNETTTITTANEKTGL